MLHTGSGLRDRYVQLLGIARLAFYSSSYTPVAGLYGSSQYLFKRIPRKNRYIQTKLLSPTLTKLLKYVPLRDAVPARWVC